MTPTVLVPVKPFSEAKSRLAEILTADAREALVRRLLERTLGVLRAAESVAGVIVVSRDAAARRIAAGHGFDAAAEPPGAGLNRALAAGARQAARRGAAGVLVLPADLPALTSDDVAAMAAAADTGPCVAIAPDAREAGTNGLLLSLPLPIAFCFGPGSFRAHRAAAVAAGLEPAIVRRPGLARDLDTPDDYALLADALRAADRARPRG